jgi:hypothetical protein
MPIKRVELTTGIFNFLSQELNCLLNLMRQHRQHRRVWVLKNYRRRGLGHGFGLGVGTIAEGWILDAVRFWAKEIRRNRVDAPSWLDGLASGMANPGQPV